MGLLILPVAPQLWCDRGQEKKQLRPDEVLKQSDLDEKSYNFGLPRSLRCAGKLWCPYDGATRVPYEVGKTPEKAACVLKMTSVGMR